MPEIFINYRTGYGHHAAKYIADHLSSSFGADRVFRDAESIQPGESYPTRLNSSAAGAQVLLVLMTHGWASAPSPHGAGTALADEADWIRHEIIQAREGGARIIPILCERALDPVRASELPLELQFLADLQALRFDHRSANNDVEQLSTKLVELIPQLKDRSKTAPPEGRATNSIRGDGHGNVVQGGVGRDVNFHGDTTTHFHAPVNGPQHSGSGSQYINNGPSPREQ